MQLKLLAQTLDDIKQENGTAYWYARNLFHLLGYTRFDNFTAAIDRAKESCKTSGINVKDHFQPIKRLVPIGKHGQEREVDDYKLTRYACYLIAQNGSTRIPEIALAQMYFAVQTRKQEEFEKSIEDMERLISRKKLTETEKEFAKTLWEREVDGKGIGEIRSAGDQALFGGFKSLAMKKKYGMTNPKKPLADLLPTVTLKAKDLATEMTTMNTKKKELKGKAPIKQEHIKNNKGIRKALVENDIRPEELPPAEDIKKIESRHKREQRKLKPDNTNQKLETQKKA